MPIGALSIAMLCAYLSGFFTLAALAYKHSSPQSDEFRIQNSQGIELFASRRRHDQYMRAVFGWLAIIFGFFALAFWFGASFSTLLTRAAFALFG